MADEVAEWKGRQRVAMEQQLALEEESLGRLEAAAAAAGEADATKGSVHGGMFGGSDVDESIYDAPNLVKVGRGGCVWLMLRQAPAAHRSPPTHPPTRPPTCAGERCVHGQRVGHQGRGGRHRDQGPGGYR
jgi:hypothetical protein